MPKNSELVEKYLAKAKKYVYKKTEDEDLVIYLHLPENIDKPFPVVVNIHGGGWVSTEYTAEREYASWGGLIDILNDKGIAFANVQYRLGSDRDRHPKLVLDCMDSLAWVSRDPEHIGFDTDRIALMGASAGGHLALLAALGTSGYPDPNRAGYKIRAIVDFCGPTDLCRFDYESFPAIRSFTEIVFGGGYDLLPDEYKRFSPVYYLDDITSPPAILMIHGDSDTIVPVQQTYRLYEAAKKRGWDVRLCIQKNGEHGSVVEGKEADPPASVVFERFIGFLDEHLVV